MKIINTLAKNFYFMSTKSIHMKKIFFACSLAIFCTTFCQAQFQYGGGVTLKLDDSEFGLNGRASFHVNEQYKGILGATYFFGNGAGSGLVLDADVHYKLVELAESVRFHPFAGLSFVTGGNSTDIGINIGAHFDVKVNDGLDIFLEPKLAISGLSSLVFTAGTMF